MATTFFIPTVAAVRTLRHPISVAAAFAEAPANFLTNPQLDPMGKIPEFKYCAVSIQAGGVLPQHSGYHDLAAK